MNKLFRYLIPALLFFTFLISCKKDDLPPDADFYISHELIMEYSREEIIQDINSNDQIPPIFANFVLYGVRVYKIVYNTVDTKGNPVEASGALLVPVTSNRMKVLSFQHGTIREEWEAPSNFLTSDYNTSTFISSSGYILVMPDYLGYGASKQIEHPYEHGRSLATACRDMLRAVYEFEVINGKFKSNEELFLTGYSEGGYATMALFKLLEEEHAAEFNITAVSVGAGAYNKTAFGEYIASANEELFFINSFLWVLDTYNKVYGLNRPYSYIFNEPYASMIENEGVFAPVNKNPQELFTNEFKEGILQETDTEFLNALADNNNYDWKPKAPLRLYHGTADDYVPDFNSLTAYEAMTTRGAQVEFISLPGEDHAAAFPSYMFGTLQYFLGF